jgi:divalent metal cation (Fe/Co/Zn/Cd) transporter
MNATDQALNRQGLFLVYLTIVWCVVEAGVSIWSGIAARSIALIGFGLDSAIEIFAALVVVWQLRGVSEERKRRALRLIAVTFFLLAAYVLVESIRDLVMGVEAEKSLAGIVVTAAALVVMPLLAWAKRRVGKSVGNPVLVAEATESALCALLSGATLLGLAFNAVLGWWWADPVAAIVIALLALKEGWEAWEGHECGECHAAGNAGNGRE